MTPLMIAALGSLMVATAFLSGLFGMAGGLILIGVLLALMPLPTAMVLHAITQMASNGWRAFLWRAHIKWKPVFIYLIARGNGMRDRAMRRTTFPSKTPPAASATPMAIHRTEAPVSVSRPAGDTRSVSITARGATNNATNNQTVCRRSGCGDASSLMPELRRLRRLGAAGKPVRLLRAHPRRRPGSGALPCAARCRSGRRARRIPRARADL